MDMSIPVDENGNSLLTKAEMNLLVKAEAKQAVTKWKRERAEGLIFESLDNLVKVPFMLPGFVQDSEERESLYQEIHAAEELVRELWHRVQKAR